MTLKSRLTRHVETLARTPRVPGTHEHSLAADYIRGCFADLGYDLSIQGGGNFCTNIVAAKGPSQGPLFVVGAHYDSVPGSPGADDNASGVAALLEVAEAFTSVRLKTRVLFVAYDREEDGLLGSDSHVRFLSDIKAKVRGMLSLEMLGYTSASQARVPGVKVARTAGDFLAVVANGNKASKALQDAFEDGPLPLERVIVQEGTQAAQLARLSDHGSFWKVGWPAVLVTDTAFLRNPHYHKASDTPDTLDMEFLKLSTEAVTSAVTRLVAS